MERGIKSFPVAVGSFQSHDPRTGAAIRTYSDADDAEISAACGLAAGSVEALRDEAARVRLLRGAAGRLRDTADALHEVCELETGLARQRLETELERTCVQLELFAAVVEEGSHVQAIIDTADPDAPVAPRPDLRRMLVPLGPVAVFGASNFPYAFSVAGGDTASALAAGCPVIVKGHPSHPGTSERVAEELRAAVADVGLPPGTLALLHGSSPGVSTRLVQVPEVEAVGFTGSLAAGRSLFDVAAKRPRPIPVYAEMGSVNPIIVTSAAIRARSEAIAEGMAAAIAMGTGQFCTKPGLVLVPDDAAARSFVSDVAARLGQVGTAPLLNARIHAALEQAVAELDGDPDARRLMQPAHRGPSGDGYLAGPVAYAVDAATLSRRPDLLEERFGPVAIFAHCPGREDVTGVLDELGGQLTVTLHAQPEEVEPLRQVVARMQEKAGRVIFDGFPTGVAVTHAMQHGGPYPATTALGHTSVGTTAVRRFQRPVVWQNAPASLLPEALQDENPLGIWRLVNGEFTRDPVR